MEHDFTGLLSRQEAALNAAGEVLTELEPKLGPIRLGRYAHDNGITATAPNPRRKNDHLFGYGATASDAMRDLIEKREKALAEPHVLERAAEAVDAVKALLPEVLNDAAIKLVSEKIDALPVKR